MPEGPEVKIVTEGLEKRLSSKTITGVQILSGRYSKKQPDGWSGLVDNLPLKVSAVACKGKFIYITFGDKLHMFNTLGMTGGWSNVSKKHSRVQFNLDDGTCVFFNDVRNFGTIKITDSYTALKQKLASLGPDMLSEDVSDETFIKRLRKSNDKTIVEGLMDQHVISGVGNYLKSECLYFSGISPHREIRTLTDIDLARLNGVIKTVIRKSYETGGATIYTFQNFEGEKGQYTRRFAVYNQVKDPHGRDVVTFTSADGRTTYWVPEEQK